LENRVAIQEIETKLPVKLFLFRDRERNKNPNLNNTHSTIAFNGAKSKVKNAKSFFNSSSIGKNTPY
jgi:hypothetical protein